MSTSYTGSTHGAPFLLILLLTACAGTPEREGVTPLQAHMYAHFDRAGEVHDALVRGNLEGARAGALWLAEHQENRRLPEGSDVMGALMKDQASRVGAASNLEEAASATAHMGRACGDCHRRNEVNPRFLVGTAPPAGTGSKAEMALHVWASERMWEGLVGPEDYAWKAGAGALKEGWLHPSDLVANPRDATRLREITQRVYSLGSEAEACTDPGERADLYGKFLTTCIDCHRLTSAIIR
ncbi:hypothetical protein ACFL0I_05620 [Gemmatimonadota bacterium]